MKKRADGRYCRQVMLGYNTDGTKKVKTVYGKTKKEVESKVYKLNKETEQNICIEDDVSVAEWAKIWLDVYKANVEYNTKYSYEVTVNTHIIPSIGLFPLKKIKTVHIQQMLNNVVKDVGVRTAQICRLTIKQIIKQAVIDGYIAIDVTAGLLPIKSDTKEKRVLSDEEKRKALNTVLDDRERIFIDLLYYTGIRKGEALALEKSDFDFDTHMMSITKNLVMTDDGEIVKSPKTQSGNRILPIPDNIIQKVQNYCDGLQTDYLFENKNGGRITKSGFRRMWDKILSQTGLEGVTPHMFRHTYATSLYFAGIDVKTMQYLMGHSNINITLKIYTHLDKEKSTINSLCKINKFFNCEETDF